MSSRVEGAGDASDGVLEDTITTSNNNNDNTNPVSFRPASRRRESRLDALIQVNRDDQIQFENAAAADISEEDGVGSEELRVNNDNAGEGGEGGGGDGPAAAAEQQQQRQKYLYQLRQSVASRPERLVEVRLHDYSYQVPVPAGNAPTIKTVANQSLCYAAYEFVRRFHLYCWQGSSGISRKNTNDDDHNPSWTPVRASEIVAPFADLEILSHIDLVLRPGRTYLVLGPPASGKTTLLKAIAGRLPSPSNNNSTNTNGRIEYNGISVHDDPSLVLPNVVSFVGQLDEHAPYLTVRETFEFAFQSRTGGRTLQTHDENNDNDDPPPNCSENLTIKGLDLGVCADTFVGNSDVRGVSGGQRRRVTVGGELTTWRVVFYNQYYNQNYAKSSVVVLLLCCRNDARAESCCLRG